MYIDSGTFWFWVIGLAVVIGIVYYDTKSKLETLKKQTVPKVDFEYALTKIGEIIDREFDNMRQEHARSNAKVYKDVGDVLEELGKAAEKANSKPQRKPKKI